MIVIMFDIQRMIKKNDFTDLLNSTQEDRAAYGGNQFIYIQLHKYACFRTINKILLYIFSEDSDMLKQIENDCVDLEKEAINGLISVDEYDNIVLP